MNKNFAVVAIVFAILFGAAFQCGKENARTDSGKRNTDVKKEKTDSRKEKTDSGDLTEEIVKRIITESVEKISSRRYRSGIGRRKIPIDKIRSVENAERTGRNRRHSQRCLLSGSRQIHDHPTLHGF